LLDLNGLLFVEIARSNLPYFLPRESIVKSVDGESGYEPDVIVLDLQMPVMDGWSASSHIKAICPDTQIIAYSSVEDAKLLEKKAMSSLDAFCKKDIPTRELIDLVKELGQRASDRSVA